jgi:rhodanese-related sulfurtransferase
MRELPPAAVTQLRDSAPVVLLDVRETWEFEHCHLDQSIHVPMQQIAARLGEFNPHATTVVICHHGMRSRQVAHYLEKNGFADVINLRGGIDAWSREIDPAIARY